MKRIKFTETQIVNILKEAEACISMIELNRKIALVKTPPTRDRCSL